MSATHNGKDVKDTGGVHLDVKQENNVFTTSINIDKVKKEDRGEIVFNAENSKGVSTAAVKLNVKGKYQLYTTILHI